MEQMQQFIEVKSQLFKAEFDFVTKLLDKYETYCTIQKGFPHKKSEEKGDVTTDSILFSSGKVNSSGKTSIPTSKEEEKSLGHDEKTLSTEIDPSTLKSIKQGNKIDLQLQTGITSSPPPKAMRLSLPKMANATRKLSADEHRKKVHGTESVSPSIKPASPLLIST